MEMLTLSKTSTISWPETAAPCTQTIEVKVAFEADWFKKIDLKITDFTPASPSGQDRSYGQSRGDLVREKKKDLKLK